MVASVTGEELVLIIGAYTGLVLGAFGLLTKFVLDTRKEASSANTAVSTCSRHDRKDDQAREVHTLRDLVEKIDERLDDIDEKTRERHDVNSRRIERVAISVDAQTRKMDRLGDAIAGVNRRLDDIETKGDK